MFGEEMKKLCMCWYKYFDQGNANTWSKFLALEVEQTVKLREYGKKREKNI